MDRLPNDLIRELASQLDIDSFFKYQAVNRHIRSVIQSRLLGLAERVARNAFPTQRRILRRQPNEDANLAWLKALRYRQLAAICLECCAPCSVLAEDPLGDSLRAKLSHGWVVMGQLARIASEARGSANGGRLPPFNFPGMLLRASELQYDALDRVRRAAIYDAFGTARRWTDLIGTLELEELQGLLYVWQDVLPTALGKASLPETTAKEDEWQSPVSRSHFSMMSWAIWTLVIAGPALLWDAWWMQRDVNEGRETILHAIMHHWEQTDRLLAYVQHEAFLQAQVSLSSRLKTLVRSIGQTYQPSAVSHEQDSVSARHLNLYHGSPFENWLCASLRIRTLWRDYVDASAKHQAQQSGILTHIPTFMPVMDGVHFLQIIKMNTLGLTPRDRSKWSCALGRHRTIRSGYAQWNAKLYERELVFRAEERAVLKHLRRFPPPRNDREEKFDYIRTEQALIAAMYRDLERHIANHAHFAAKLNEVERRRRNGQLQTASNQGDTQYAHEGIRFLTANVSSRQMLSCPWCLRFDELPDHAVRH